MEERNGNNLQERGKAVRAEIRKTRHKAEVPLHVISVILTAALAGFATLAGIGARIMDTTGMTEEQLEIVKTMRTFGGFLALILLVAVTVFLLAVLYKISATTLCYNVRVTEKNFPEIYQKAQEFTALLGMKKVPDIFVVQENGALNAFAACVPGRRFIQLNAEVLDVAYLENHDFEAVYFVMAHEFGHQYLRHVNLGYKVAEFCGMMIPIFKDLVSRSKEYSADRVAQALTGSDGKREMPVLMAGRHLYPYVDVDDYLEKNWKKRSFFEKVGCFYVNLCASHPVNYLRFQALADPEKKSGRLF